MKVRRYIKLLTTAQAMGDIFFMYPTLQAIKKADPMACPLSTSNSGLLLVALQALNVHGTLHLQTLNS
jgi:hypothetical protein